MNDIDKIIGAIIDDDILGVERYLDSENINEFNEEFITPLMMASRLGRYYIVKYLVEQGADINLRSPDDGYSPLLDALSSQHEKIALYLMENGANVIVKGSDGNIPIMFAIEYGQVKAAEKLIELDCDITTTTMWGVNALHGACKNGHFKIVQLLIQKGVNIESVTDNGETPLALACSSGHKNIAEFLISHNADINNGYDKDYSMTPLFLAVKNDHKEIAEYLYSIGAKLSTENLMNAALIGLTINFSMSDFTMKLIDDVNDDVINYYEDDMDKVTLVSSASGMGQLDIVGKLVKRGADINAQDIIIKSNPLFKAIFNNHPRVVYFLLEMGANLKVTDWENNTPLDIALDTQHEEVIEVFNEFIQKNNINPNDICNKDTFKQQ
jgi:ankyrin repeat protein